MGQYDCLKLENQLCFPLYAAAREVVKRYTPYLQALDLTYTQYVVLMVLWESREVTAHALGERLYLDSGTLTPVLKSLENKGLVTRKRDPQDERRLKVSLTKAGEALKAQAAEVPKKMGACIGLSASDAQTLYTLLYRLLASFEK